MRLTKADGSDRLEFLEHHHGLQGRLFFTSNMIYPGLNHHCNLIRVPPLRARRQDLGTWLSYSIRQQNCKLRWHTAPEVPQMVIQQLQAYDFPNNIRKLDMLVFRTLQQIDREDEGTVPMLVPEDVF
ncbi:MAG: hypothetical protein ACON4T_07715 [Synechococcus sp.]